MINNGVRLFFRSQPVEQRLQLKLGYVLECDVIEGWIDVVVEVVEVGASRRVSPVGAAYGDVEIPHPITKRDGSVCRSGDRTAVDGGQFRSKDLLGVGPVPLRLVAHNAAAVMSLWFTGCGIGVDVVVGLPAATLVATTRPL